MKRTKKRKGKKLSDTLHSTPGQDETLKAGCSRVMPQEETERKEQSAQNVHLIIKGRRIQISLVFVKNS
jgi:hypothetical protein